MGACGAEGEGKGGAAGPLGSPRRPSLALELTACTALKTSRGSRTHQERVPDDAVLESPPEKRCARGIQDRVFPHALITVKTSLVPGLETRVPNDALL